MAPKSTLCTLLVLLAALTACSDSGGGGNGGIAAANAAESCMLCHNASQKNDYAGPGMENPHPFGAADKLKCTTCHGGDPKGDDKDSSHVPPPPQIGDDAQLLEDPTAYFNRLTLTGIDKFPDYQVGEKVYSALDYLQFINPGDLRVVDDGRSCGACHRNHVEDVQASLLATSTGVLSGATYAIGADNAIPEHQGLYNDTAADLGFRAVQRPTWTYDPALVGAIGSLLEYPVFSQHGVEDPTSIFKNDLYNAATLSLDVNADNTVVTNSPLANLYHEQVAFTCGDCHLGSAGANNRYGDFRSSGCTACHMPYALDGRYDGLDPNLEREEPFDPDEIEAPERAHVRQHRILSVARSEPDGSITPGIDDYACAGCHQGSNRTVMQYWGIRLDQNEDLRRDVQYPANPVTYRDTRNDPRLFDPEVGNRTFNGRDDDQYIVFEDYDGDGRDDTPADVHYEAGMGCIDCHGSFDLHGGDTSTPGSELYSRMEHGTAASCESCHGTADAYATTVAGTTYAGESADVTVDKAGNAMPHVTRDGDGHYWLRSRLTGALHYIRQTRDVVVDNGRLNPITSAPLYSAPASYAMGRDDGDPDTGLGPQQAGLPSGGFCHSDRMDCASCHASWTNTCTGCHLEGEYNTNPNNHSNITGERIVFRERNADFVYQSPIPFQLGVGAENKITTMSANTKMFFKYRDRHGDFSDVFAFSDRNGGGNSASTAFPSLSHNALMAHSIRGKVEPENEGPRYCVACHLTEDGLAAYGEAEYDAFRTALSTGDFGALNYPELQTHIGRNPGNQLDSPLFVHMVAGLGTGLFLFDENGCPINPLDNDDDRAGCEVAPASIPFDPSSVAFDLDRIVEPDGTSNASNNHPMQSTLEGPSLRDGAADPGLEGPLGASIIQLLTDPDLGVVLDSWIDADGLPQGQASTVLDGP